MLVQMENKPVDIHIMQVYALTLEKEGEEKKTYTITLINNWLRRKNLNSIMWWEILMQN